jgi:hypothetical protein
MTSSAGEGSPRDEALPSKKPLDWSARSPREARSKLLEALRLDLLGPEASDEQLPESPITRYATGMLAPFGTLVADEERDESLTSDEAAEETGAVEVSPPMSQAITPSSIGLSFLGRLSRRGGYRRGRRARTSRRCRGGRAR